MARAVLCLALAALAGSGAFYAGAHREAGPKKGKTKKAAYDFRLTDQHGAPYELASQRGRIVLFSFGFTHCPSFCPTLLNKLARVYGDLSPDQQQRVQVVFITLDPARDSPDVLREYVSFFDEHIVGLTGPQAEIDRAVRAYGADYQVVTPRGAAAGQYFINHSTFAYLVDADGNLSAVYNFFGEDAEDRLSTKLRALLSGNRSGQG